ncbi:hypothetical protein S245_060407, partial [Arachis hypogaea]
NSNYVFPNWFYKCWDFFGPISEILPSATDEGYKLFQSSFDIQETCVPIMLNFFSIFSLSWVFSWQYQYTKLDHPKAFPILQRHAYVKWWSQFDSSMAYPEKVKEWFKTNPKTLPGSQSKQSIKGKLQLILHLLQEDEESSSKEESDVESKDSQVEEHYFE